MNEQAIKTAMQTGCEFFQYNTESQVEDVVRYSFSEAQRMKGQSGADANIVSTAVKKITEVILRDYPTLTDKEFELILEAGVSGEFSKDTWVNGANVLQWLKAYQNDKSRITVIDEQEEETKKAGRKTQAEIDELNRQAVEGKMQTATEYCKEEGCIFGTDDRAFHLPQFAAVCYDYLRERGDIPELTDAQKAEAMVYAARMIVQKNTRREFIPSAQQDWEKSHLLELYIKANI